MNFYVYKIIDTENKFYYYVLSPIKDENIVLQHCEHWAAHEPNESVNKYYNLIGWDAIDIERVTDIKPEDIITCSIPQDEKCINKSDKFMEFIIEPPKKEKKQRAPKEAKEAKPKPKPKGKKATMQEEIK